ncbi:MAG: signal recognition particle-docking protein FtsY [Eubacteriales bacterium]|nr:signal recognition particle-docking protein FtsY [Eubacteriales bacterium]
MAGFFERLKEGLKKTRNSIADSLDSVFGDYSQVDDDFFDELEEVLVMADMGIHTTDAILSDLKKKIHEQHIKEPGKCRELLIESIAEQMKLNPAAYDFENTKSVVLVIGVNGVGKTTSIGKLGINLKNEGKNILFCAADTFRAAAIEQLTEWANRGGIDIISQNEGSDPASVVFDAIAAYKKRNKDILICDTAGRLHNKKNLMDELSKINRIIDRELPGIHKEVLLVLDGTTGQNALSQAKEFLQATSATGIILTKMDGTAKGGIAVAISSELSIPVKYIGVGEHAEDLQRFDAEQFVRALFTEQ